MKYAYAVVALVVLLTIGAYLLLEGRPPAPPPDPTPALPVATPTTTTATYYCTGARTMQAIFRDGSVELKLSDGRTFTLPQVPSGSGVRYEDRQTRYGTDVAFVGKGDNAFLTENSHATYADCTAALVVDSDAPGYATYTDQGKTFTFAFPTNFSVAGSAIGLSQDWAAEASVMGMRLAHLAVPQSELPGTNFVDASFTVGASSDPAAVAGCLISPAIGGMADATRAPQEVLVGTMKFTKLEFLSAAAGNRYDTTSYRVVRGGQCWAVEYTIHSGAIENYPKGSVKELDKAALTASLDEVAKSFQFLK